MTRFQSTGLWTGLGVLLVLVSGCATSKGTVRQIPSAAVVGVPIESRATSSVDEAPEIIAPVKLQEPAIRVNCRATLSKDDELVKALVEQRVRDGNYYAALAQIQSLPSEVATVAALRADILRQLQSPQAEAWYVALQGSCLAGRAEHGLGLLAAQRNDYTQALKRLISASRLLPADSRVRNDLGFLYLHLNMDAPAEFELRTAYELAPEDKVPGFNLALLALLRQDEGAWAYWSDRVSLTTSDREELLHSCQYLMRKRSRSQSSVSCPMSPRTALPNAVQMPTMPKSK